jgi:uncharacterized repeat protein (TIGR02543 family)
MEIKATFFRLTVVILLRILFLAFFTAVSELAFSVTGNLWQKHKASLKDLRVTVEAWYSCSDESNLNLGCDFVGLRGATKQTCQVGFVSRRAHWRLRGEGREMKMRRIATLLVFLLLTAPLLMIRTVPAETSSVYFSVEPVAIPSLTDTNASINGLETPPTPSPVGQNFTVEIHLIGASTDNVPTGISGIEVHFHFGNILTYAIPTSYIDMTGVAGGVLTGPTSKLLYGISAGFYDASGNSISGPPYTGAVYYEVAAASTATTGWNNADGIVAKITFQIIKQPQSNNGEATAYLPLTCDFTDLADKNVASVNHDTIQGTLTIDATSGTSITQYSLTVKVDGNGTVTQNPLNTTYASNTNVTLTAAPGAGWTFQGWSGDLTGVQNPVNITMNGNKTVTATFTQPGQHYTLTVNVVGNGTVTQNPLNTTYASGAIVTLTAVPSASWTFQGWSGDLTGTQNPTNITVNGNKTVTATFVTGTFGGRIDLFTQKSPFSGKGPNQSSDAFQQQELVVLYALVTFSGDPIANKIVAFQVNGPANSLQNLTVTGTGTTNSSGIAEFSFRMPTAPANGQQTVFGEWFAVATVDVDQVQLSDSLTFEVGWIVSIKSIVTLNDKLVPQTSFARLDTVVFNVTLENIALTPRSATITVDAQDVTGNLVIHIELDNLSIPPGESYTQSSSQIPETARLGEANVTATAYTAPPSSGGTPYSPSVYTTFNIVTAVYYTLTVNIVGNGSVTKTPFAASYLRNTNVTLTAVPGANWTFQGWSDDVTGTQGIVSITMDGNKIVTATFTQIGQQYYTLTVNVVGNGTVTISPQNATYLSGTIVSLTAVPAANWVFQGWSGDAIGVQNPVNVTMDGNKTVTATFTLVSVGHDVAITAVSVSPSQVQAGEVVQIVVVAANLGGYSETFNVTVYYDSNIIQVIPTVSMLPRSSETLTVEWNTTNINPGVYTMSANATIVEGDTNPDNNNFTDGQVTITSTPVPGQLIPYPVILILFLTGLAILGGVATLMLFVAYSIKRRKRKARRTPHYVIVSHPHI